MSTPAYLAGVLVVYDRESLKMARSIDRMADLSWLPLAKRCQCLDRDLTLGAVSLSEALNVKRVRLSDYRRAIRLFVKQARDHARLKGVPLPRLSYWPRRTPRRKRRRR